MPIVLIFVILVLIVASVLIVPISIVQRYRTGVSRQPARAWLAALNLIGFSLSAAIFVAGAAMTTFWVPDALKSTLIGLAGGGALGLLGLALTRWESAGSTLYFTPNRWLVLLITLVVSARIVYGFWRSWETWDHALNRGSWLVTSGIAGSLGAGAVVLGYYVVYWWGVRRWIRRAGPIR